MPTRNSVFRTSSIEILFPFGLMMPVYVKLSVEKVLVVIL